MKGDKDGWWDWRAKPTLAEECRVNLEAQRLEGIIERCVVLDNLSPASTVHTIRTALEQFGRVCGVKLLKDTLTGSFTGIAFAEMETKEQMQQVVRELKDYLLMIGQMPRPARALPATVELMVDHPLRKPAQKVQGRFVRRTDPRWKEFQEIAVIVNQNLNAFNELLQLRREEEAKLEKAQERQCLENMEKLKMLLDEKSSQEHQMIKNFYK